MKKTTYVVWKDGSFISAVNYDWENEIDFEKMLEPHHRLDIPDNIKVNSIEFHDFIKNSS